MLKVCLLITLLVACVTQDSNTQVQVEVSPRSFIRLSEQVAVAPILWDDEAYLSEISVTIECYSQLTVTICAWQSSGRTTLEECALPITNCNSAAVTNISTASSFINDSSHLTQLVVLSPLSPGVDALRILTARAIMTPY